MNECIYIQRETVLSFSLSFSLSVCFFSYRAFFYWRQKHFASQSLQVIPERNDSKRYGVRERQRKKKKKKKKCDVSGERESVCVCM